MTTPPRDEAVVPMWGGPKSRPPNLYLYPAKWEAGCVEYRALPAAEFDALVARVEAAEGALDDARLACADLCRARADAYAKEGEALKGLEKVLVLAREAAALSCEHTILARLALRASGTREGE